MEVIIILESKAEKLKCTQFHQHYVFYYFSLEIFISFFTYTHLVLCYGLFPMQD